MAKVPGKAKPPFGSRSGARKEATTETGETGATMQLREEGNIKTYLEEIKNFWKLVKLRNLENPRTFLQFS
ncbi:MAG: hypothetical protein NZ602_06310 [Thermoguttaceae bacterium]|nr:hypothetical protein [Thermoguttaceae bacterium]MDW8036870.1 hypothetical protein [Thermoguttaceae bacterium]